MIRTGAAAIAPRIAGTIELEISDPVTMLNEVARRYETTERVLMEYVDNSLDDAELLYRANNEAYPYPIQIEVLIDLAARTATISDNCSGMTKEILERTVRNVGESRKRGLPWVNGRFGFGVHSFRAAAEVIHFYTRAESSPPLELTLPRNQHQGIKEARRGAGPFPTGTGTGTIITISSFEPDWFEGVSIDSVKQEIERHFDRLLARPNLAVTVRAAGQAAVRCAPFDFEQYPGQEIRRVLTVDYNEERFSIPVYLKIAERSVPEQAVSFFSRGRRVEHAVDIKSFMRKSIYKTGLWGHPHLIGYIDVGEIVKPTITRHDFVRTKRRQLFYEAILNLEPELKGGLARINVSQREATFDHLERALERVLARVAGADWQQFNPQQKGEEQPDGLNFDIQFVDEPADESGQIQRAYLRDQIIAINVAHPDFKERMSYTRQGQPKISDRLGAYVAAIITMYYKDRFYDRYGQAPDRRDLLLGEQLDFTFRLEAAIRKQLPKLERQLARTSKSGGSHVAG